MWTKIRLLLREQSDLGPHCLLQASKTFQQMTKAGGLHSLSLRLLKHFRRRQKQTTLVMIGHNFYVVCWLFFSKLNFSKNFKNTIRVSNSLDPDQAQCSVGMIWVQTVCKDQQQMTKFLAGSQRANSKPLMRQSQQKSSAFLVCWNI